MKRPPPELTELTAPIDRLLASQRRVVVAISGFGGSGKTRLAGLVRSHYGVGERQVVHVDDFIVDRARGEGMLGGFDWARLTEVLEDVRAGRRLRFTPNDFDGAPRGPAVDEALPAVVIVEGVRLLRPELARFFDLTVWLDCPVELAAARGMERDCREGAGEAHLALWESEWVPKDLEYFAAHRPDLTADFLWPGRYRKSLPVST